MDNRSRFRMFRATLWWKMNRGRCFPLLLLGLILLLAGPVIDCSGTTLKSSYWNDDWAFGLKVPEGWTMDEFPWKEGYPGCSITLWAPAPTEFEPGPWVVCIHVSVQDMEKLEIPTDVEVAVQRVLDKAPELFGDITVLENRRMKGKWDWYLSFEDEEGYLREFYFMWNKYGYCCDLGVVCPKEDYGLYPWEEMVESFIFEPILLRE